jgi:hypothetical protein
MRTIAILFLVLGTAGVFVGFGGVTINGWPPFGVPRTVYLVAAFILVLLGGVALLFALQRPRSGR